MASLRASTSTMATGRIVAGRSVPVICALPARTRTVLARAQPQQEQATASIGQAVALSAAVSTLLSADNALAANELATLAASDNRPGLLLTLLVPVAGWVLFNIGSGLFNQLDIMGDKAADTTPDKRSLRLKRSLMGALGLGAASLLASAPAEAANELATLAASDSRPAILATLLVPVAGWVLFNIGGGLLNQLDVMGDKAADTTPDKRSLRKKRSIAGALGLGAAGLLAAAPAEAATELANLAAGDNRVSILATLLVPVAGWVLFNIGGGLLNQLDIMGDKAADTTPDKRSLRLKRSMMGALGLGAASLLASAPAEAANELATLAASDNRPAILATLLVPVAGWVLFNIGGGLFNQLDVMGDKAADTPPDKRSIKKQRSIAGALGLGAAGLLAAAPAEAATELANLAAGDNRVSILATLLVPVAGWVLFNIGGGLLNQLDIMGDKAADTTPDKRSLRLKR